MNSNSEKQKGSEKGDPHCLVMQCLRHSIISSIENFFFRSSSISEESNMSSIFGPFLISLTNTSRSMQVIEYPRNIFLILGGLSLLQFEKTDGIIRSSPFIAGKTRGTIIRIAFWGICLILLLFFERALFLFISCLISCYF